MSRFCDAYGICASGCSIINARRLETCGRLTKSTMARWYDDDEIERLEADGCTVILNGVSETFLGGGGDDDECSNSGPAQLCQLIDAGILSCADDFCPGTCAHSRECDLSCGFCHRRAQLASVIHTSEDCGPLQFSARTDAVDAACCSELECPGGVPDSCDAACAPVFDLYYKEVRTRPVFNSFGLCACSSQAV